MVRRAIPLSILVPLFGFPDSPSLAQGLRADAPRTQIEEFTRATDTVVILGLTRVGQIRSDLGGTVGLSAMSLRDVSTGRSTFGITVEVIEAERAGRESNSFVDFDEIDKMLDGIDHIMKATSGITAHENFEAYYKTKGELEIVVFNGANKAISASVASGIGAKSRVFISIEQLAELREMIAEAARISERNRFK